TFFVYVSRTRWVSMTQPRATHASDVARSADAYAQISRLLIRGRIPPGTRVSEADLMVRLGVGRTPVREAMRRLLSEGLLVGHGGGARPRMASAPVSAPDILELYETAGAIEGVAARRIVELPTRARRDLVTQLRALDAEFRRATRARPLDYDVLFERHN